MRHQQKTLSHEEASTLLPWLTNGSLAENEIDRVLDHVRACMECRREVKHLDLLRDAVLQDADASPIPSPDVRKMMSRIEYYEDRRISGPVARLSGVLQRHRYFTFMTQGAVLMVLVAILLWPDTQEPQFTTLTQVENLSSGNYIRTVFNPGLSESDVLNVATKLSLNVVSGPSARGVYTLGAAQEISSAELDELAFVLRGQPEVLFAESVRIGVEP